MNILFPANFNSKNQIDDSWQKEAEAAKSVGFDVSILIDGYFGSPIKIYNKKSPSLYRGWIVTPQVYQEVDSLGAELINSYNSYMWSYEFPKWYLCLEEYTPHSLIIKADEIVKCGLEGITPLVIDNFNSQSIMIKDFLKSRKHEWYDACFIRDASDRTELIRVMSNFFKLQGREFYGGLVFREFLNLKKIGFHPKSKMPLPLEFRTFFVNGKPVFTTPYWSNDVSYPDNVNYPPNSWLEEVGKNVNSPFVALDIAQDENDKWWVIEVNDGGISGLPSHVNLESFYKILYDQFQ